MADKRLRELEREAELAPDDVQAQAALLRERVRVRELTRERLQVAGWCGDIASRIALGCEWRILPNGEPRCGPLPSSKCHAFGDPKASGLCIHACPDRRSRVYWLASLERWGEVVHVRAAVAAAREALPVWEDSNLGPHACYMSGLSVSCAAPEQHAPRRAIEAAERWLEHPSLPHHMEWAAVHAGPGTPAQPMFVVRPWDARTGQLGLRIEASAYLAGEQLVREAISTALIAWALGGSRG